MPSKIARETRGHMSRRSELHSVLEFTRMLILGISSDGQLRLDLPSRLHLAPRELAWLREQDRELARRIRAAESELAVIRSDPQRCMKRSGLNGSALHQDAKQRQLQLLRRVDRSEAERSQLAAVRHQLSAWLHANTAPADAAPDPIGEYLQLAP